MELDFITRLEEQDLIELINFCIKKQNEKYQEVGFAKWICLIDNIVVYNEINRKDVEGNCYFWICTFNGARVLDNYRIKDFEMMVDNIGLYGRNIAIDYTQYMREFMAKHFGKEYIQALFQYQTKQAEKEMQRLLDVLGKEKII